MWRRAVPVLCLSMLFSACYMSAGKETDGQPVDGVPDPAPETLTDGPEGPDSSEPQADPIWDPGGDVDLYDFDDFEFDGYSPPTCRLFAVDVEWDADFEEPYVSQAFFESSNVPMLSVIALYEATDCVSHSRCPVTVQVSRTYRPMVLLLSSYEPVEWVIQRAEGAVIERILLTSYYDSTVSGADDVPTDLDYGQYTGYCWPMCSGEDTEIQVRAIAAALGLELASFHGTYKVPELGLWHVCREECLEEVVCAGRECGMNECGYECGTCPPGHVCVDHACMACSPDCTGRVCGSDGCDGSCGACPEDFICVDGRCSEAPYYTGCEDVTTETHYCITISGSGTALFGLDSGLVCPLGKGSEVFSDHMMNAHSIALLDGHLFMCVDEIIDHTGAHGILRFSMLSGLWEVIPVLCSSLARYENGLIVQPDMSLGPSGVVYYPSLEDLRDGIYVPMGSTSIASRMTVNGHTLYTAWHSTSEIDRYQLPSGTSAGTIHLEGYDTWVQGLAVTDDGLLVCNASWPEGRVAVFDEATGDHLYDVLPVNEEGADVGITGLVCFTNP